MAGFSYGGGSGGDNTPLSQSFTNITEFTVNHNFNYMPNVWVINDLNELIFVSMEYGVGTVTIYSITNISGTIYLR